MLRRFNQIKNSGIFTNFSWESSAPEFGNINLIYGANGAGKTSLAQAIDIDDLGNDRIANVDLSVEVDGTTRSTRGRQDSIFERIYVFSEEYIQRAQSLLADEGSLEAILTLGTRSVEAEERIAALTKDVERDEKIIEDTDSKLGDLKSQIESVYERVSTDVVADLTKVGGEYQSRGRYSVRVVRERYHGSREEWEVLNEESLTQAKQMVSSQPMERIDIGNLAASIPNELVAETRDLLATTPVTIVLDTLEQHPEASAWVQSGQQYHADATHCIYCGNNLSNERKAQIEQHFSGEVEQLQQRIEANLAQLDSIGKRLESSENGLPDEAKVYEDLRQIYTEEVSAYFASCRALKEWIADLRGALERKYEQPLAQTGETVADPPMELSGEGVEAVLSEHNSRADDHETLVRDSARKIELHHLARSEQDVDRLNSKISQLDAEVSELKQKCDKNRAEIQTLSQVEHDPQPSASVLTREVARILGRTELVFEPSGDRYKVLRSGEAASRLSSGERTAIALVHFMELVARADPARGKAIVVIDDPVSSLDSNVFLGVSTYIWTECVNKGHIDQLFLLTHNFDLFRQWDIQLEGVSRLEEFKSRYSTQMYELVTRHSTRRGTTTRVPTLQKWPPSEEVRKKVRSSYHHAFFTLASAKLALDETDDLDTRLDAQLLFPNVIRKFLETFLAFKRPDMGGDFTRTMRKSADMLQDAGYAGDANGLRLMLTRYAHAYSHDDTPESGAIVNPDEVRTALASVFTFVNCLDPDHFSGLCSVKGMEVGELIIDD